MTRQFLFAALITLALGPAETAEADPFYVTSAFSVDRPQERTPDPTLKGRIEGTAGSFYGGVNGRTLPEPDRAAAFDLYVGLRPQIGRVALDLGYSRQMSDGDTGCCGQVAVGLGGDVGARARLGARLQVDPQDEIATAEASATVDLFETTRIAGRLGHRFDVSPDGGSQLTLDVGASRPLGTGASMDLRFSDASSRAGRAELSMRLQF